MGIPATKTTDIQRLRAEIASCRRGRHVRAPLPKRMWADAVAVARRIGVNQARLALGLSYEGLRAHVARSGAFVELTGAEVLAAGTATTTGTSIEIRGREVHIVVRLGDTAVDVASLVEAVRGHA